MIKIDLSNLLLDLSGKPLLIPDINNKPTNQKLSVSLANVFAQATDSLDPLKAWNWARALHDNDELQVDEVDLKSIKSFVKDKVQLPVIIKAQLLEAFDKE